MTDLDTLINECYNKKLEKVNNIYNAFKEQFGEDNIDIQNILSKEEFNTLIHSKINNENLNNEEDIKYLINSAFEKTIEYKYIDIIVHWPHVKITNEYDKFTEADDLWAKTTITYDGRIVEKFKLNRSSYSYLHISNGYMHSHINSICFRDLQVFQTPCTGSGPINATISTLKQYYDIDLWGMYCCELNNFITVESIAGVPYHRLESLGSGDNNLDYRAFKLIYQLNYYQTKDINLDLWKSFIREVINRKVLKFCFYEDNYHIGMSIPEVAILFTNIFIDWFNKLETTITLNDLLEHRVLRKGVYSGGIIYGIKENDTRDYSSFIGKKVLTFKGKDILLSINDFSTESENYSLILSSNIVYYILTLILQVINYRYGREKTDANNGKINCSTLYI